MSRRPGQPKFSTLWKIFFHSVEKSPKCFPYCGKPGRKKTELGRAED